MIRIKNTIPQKNSVISSSSFRRFFDELIPSYVKKTYLPSKKTIHSEKPFSRVDAQFFMKGIRELSSEFTEQRTAQFFSAHKNYFTLAKFRSSYLLYFLPLHLSKFFLLFQRHLSKNHPALHNTPTLKILDIGAGPGTASFAFLLWILENKIKVQKIEFTWLDQNPAILEDGRKLLEIFQKTFSHCPEVVVHTHTGAFQTQLTFLKKEFSLILCGQVLNEATHEAPLLSELFQWLLPSAPSLGVLVVEPASKKTSQFLSELREHTRLNVLESEIVGPCLHSEKCPLLTGKDWCHFSTPTSIQTNWFTFFSKGLGSIREWVKYSYLWVQPKSASLKKPKKNDLRLVISNPLAPKFNKKGAAPTVLLCEPNQVLRVTLTKNTRVFRGDHVLI